MLEEFKSSVLIGLFIFLFLFLFKPFGLETAGAKALEYAFYFGLATTVVSLFYEVLLAYILRIDRQSHHWTFGKWLISVLFLIILIAMANYSILAMIYDGFDFSAYRFLRIAYSTFLVGIFPIFFIGFIKLNHSLRKHENLARNYNISKEESDHIWNIGSSENGSLDIPVNNFLYAEAMQNYIALNFIDDGMHRKELIRQTMKELESTIPVKSIQRCHRSFIVNKNHISSITGNAQGLKLEINNKEDSVPVSRSYIDKFK